jgi:hypothetical protein
MDREIADLLPAEHHSVIIKFYDNSFKDMQKECRRRFTEPIATVDHCLTKAIINILKMVLTIDKEKVVLDELEGTKLHACLERLFLFAYAWGCGA